MEATVVVEKTGADPLGAFFTSDGKGGREEGIETLNREWNCELRIANCELGIGDAFESYDIRS